MRVTVLLAILLSALTKITGGRHHMVENIAQLPDLASQMSLALHDRYLIAYKPTLSGLPAHFAELM